MPEATPALLDLRTIPAAIINLPSETLRRQKMVELFSQLGIRHQFFDGVSKHRKKRNVAAAMIKAHDAFSTAPFMVCEDDLQLMQSDVIIPAPPPDADIVYLAKSHFGCLPNRPDHIEQFGFCPFDQFALAEAHDEHYFRLTSMISAIAILVVSEQGRQRYREELRKSFNRDVAVDIRYAFAMPDLRVYAPRLPVFAEDMALQPPDKCNEARRLVTHSPLVEVREGDTRRAETRKFQFEVRARRDSATGALEWNVERTWPIAAPSSQA